MSKTKSNVRIYESRIKDFMYFVFNEYITHEEYPAVVYLYLYR